MRVFFAFCLLAFAFSLLGCGSIPNLESPECTQARDSVRQFYSWYFGTDAEQRAKQPEIIRKFMAASFVPYKVGGIEREPDPYTMTRSMPTTFKLAQCKASGPESVYLKVQFLWKPGESGENGEMVRLVHLQIVKDAESWKISSILPNGQ